jgi:proteasome assembly chaperone (PAC2) family protein
MTAIIQSMSDPTVILHRPALKAPALIAGFDGWSNAGEVSTWVVNYLLKILEAIRCAEIRPERFYNLCEQRPVLTVEAGKVLSVHYPANSFYAVEPHKVPGRDLVLFLGQEPHLQWPEFTRVFLDIAQHLGVTEIITLGGVYDNVPHTVEPLVTGITNQDRYLEYLPTLAVQLADYEGPMSIHTELLVSAVERNIPVTSLWGHVPYYIQSNNAKTALALLKRLQGLLALQFDTTEVHHASRSFDEQIDRIIAGKPELRDFVKTLERDFAHGTPQGSPAKASSSRPETNPSDKIIRIDPFLRKE